jgi:hypothetical protein
MVLIRAIRLSRWSVSGGLVNDCGKLAYSVRTRPSFEVTGSVGIGS